jgi:hypothetical protein
VGGGGAANVSHQWRNLADFSLTIISFSNLKGQ